MLFVYFNLFLNSGVVVVNKMIELIKQRYSWRVEFKPITLILIINIIILPDKTDVIFWTFLTQPPFYILRPKTELYTMVGVEEKNYKLANLLKTLKFKNYLR